MLEIDTGWSSAWGSDVGTHLSRDRSFGGASGLTSSWIGGFVEGGTGLGWLPGGCRTAAADFKGARQHHLSGSLGDGRGDNATGPPPNAGEDDGTPNLMSTPIGASGYGNTQLLFQEGGNEQTPQSTSQVRRPQPWRLPPPLLMSEDRSQSPMAGSLSSGMHTPKQRTRLWGIGGDRPPPLPPRLKRQRSR